MLGRFSLAIVGLWVGGVLTIVGFAAYFSNQPTLNLIGFFYGIPILLGGLALKASELEPVPLTEPTSPEVESLRDRQATDTQRQIAKDVMRYRYGQRAHLDSSLEHLGLSPNREEQPDLIGLHEAAIDGAYALVLEFDSPFLPLSKWQDKREKIERFFGPGLRVEVSQPVDEEIHVALISNPTDSNLL